MDYDPVSFLHWICGVTEVVGGHPLKNRRCSSFGIHVGWPLYQSPGGHNGQLSISARSGAVSYFVADFNLGHAGAYGFNHAGALNAYYTGQRRAGIYALATVDIREIHASGLNLNHRLTVARRWIGDVHIFHDLGAAKFRDLNCFHVKPS